jgi:hypothetical protein
MRPIVVAHAGLATSRLCRSSAHEGENVTPAEVWYRSDIICYWSHLFEILTIQGALRELCAGGQRTKRLGTEICKEADDICGAIVMGEGCIRIHSRLAVTVRRGY